MLITLLVSLLILLGEACSAEDSAFRQADPSRVMVFPKDHGKHTDFQTEWWYFTGNLESPGNQWGFQLTFFRRSLFAESPSLKSSWTVRDIYPAHFALTDVNNKQFHHAEVLSREGPGIAGASEDDLRVWVGNWRAEKRDGNIHIRASKKGYSLDLDLCPLKEKVLHGQGGYSRKGDNTGQSSHYYSFTKLEAQGTLTFEGKSHSVHGLAWMDHEFGSSILLPGQAGWDWFSLHLNDGSEVMVFHLRKDDGTFERPFGTLVPPQGGPIDLDGRQITISPTKSWVSPRSMTSYPSGWKIEIQDHKISLEIEPLVQDQELTTTKSTHVTYWEGAVQVTGARDGKPVRGKGYAELTGYAHSMGGSL